MPTLPPTITPVPSFPPLSDRVNYNSRAFAWAGHMATTYATEMLSLAASAYGNAVETAASASVAANAANAAAASAAAANASATTAASAAGAVAWVSGATYAQYFSTIDPINLQTYRRRVAGAGTTPPSQDRTNWKQVGVSKGQLWGMILTK